MMSSDFGCMLYQLVCFEDRFCVSKNGGMVGGGEADLRHAVYIVAPLAGCRMTLVSTGWTALTLLAQTTPLPL